MAKSKGRRLAEFLRRLNASGRVEDASDIFDTSASLTTSSALSSGTISNADDDDTKLATNAAVIDHVDSKLTALGLQDLNNTAFTGLTSGHVLAYNGTNWVNSNDFIGLTDLSVGTPNSASSSGAISYSNSTGEFKYTPPDLSSYLTSTDIAGRLRFDDYQTLTTAQKNIAKSNLGLAAVASTGAYSDLSGLPTIPSSTSQLTNNSGFITSSSIPTNNNQLANGAGYITNGSNYNVNNQWLRENGDNADVKLYGNSRQMTFRTDGTSGGTGGHTGYPFRWTYGGNADANTKMLLHTDGRVWTPYYGWFNDAFVRADADDTITGKISVGSTSTRRAGMYGIYDSYKIGHIWSMGTAYQIPQDGSSFGNLYGAAYTYHNRVYTSNTMGGYHQMVWCQNGTPNCALGSNIWTSGNVTAYSDIRVKENIELIPNALEKVKKLNGYTFDRTDVELPRQTGVIAQEVLEVLPEAVIGDEDSHYNVAYGNMVGLLIEAIKEQQEQIEELKSRLQ